MKTNFSKMFGEMIGRVLGKGEVRYYYPRDPQGRFSQGEGGDPEVKRRKIDAAVREAHRRILDNPDDTARAAYDAAADQGLSGHDAQEVFQLVDQKMRKEAEALAKAGTSDGAKKGWETRRGGGDSPEDKPSQLMSPQLEDVVRRGYVTDGVVDDPGLTTTEGAKAIIVRKKDGSSASYLSLLPPTKQDPNWTVGSGATAKSERKKGLWSAITSEAAAFAQSQGTSLGSGQIVSQENKAFWEKLTSAGKAVRQDEHHYVFVGDAPKPEKADKTLEKAGTSEGAKRGWETRRGGGTQPESAGPSDGKAILDGLKEPITNLDDAIKMLREGKGVMFDRPDHAVVLLDKMAEAVKAAKDKGEKAPVFDLCKVMVKGASLFCHQNMKIPRDQMPQLSGAPQEGTPSDKLPRNKAGHVNVRDALLDSLAEKGIKIEKTEESAGRMRASQNQMDGGKVGEMLKSLEKGTLTPAPLFISKENYVVDGHHGWAATVAKEYKEGKEIKIPVYRVDMPILDLLKYTTDFSSKMGLRQKEFGKSLAWALFGGKRIMGAFPMTQEQALAKEGTSEGAKKGWETRRGGVSLGQNDFKGDDLSISTNGLMEKVTGELASQWNVTHEDLKRLAKEEERDEKSVAEMTPEKLKESLVGYLLRTWAGGSGGPVPTAMTTGVADRLGLEYRLDESGKETNKYIKADPALDRATASLGEAMYSSTQKWLKERGVESVALYRKGGLAEDRLFSSWSTSWGGTRHEGGGDYVKVRVPVSQVFSTPATGFGTLAESEVVLLPGKRDVIASGEKDVSKGQPIAKAGTSEGAILGWQTRRTGGKGADPEVRVKALEEGVVHLGNLDSKLEAIVNDETAEIDREGENNRRGIPTDYMGMVRRATERRQEGYRLLKQSIETLKTIKPKTREDADLVGNLLRYAEKDAERASREESEIPWDKQFDLLLTLARGATERAAAAERAELKGKP